MDRNTEYIIEVMLNDMRCIHSEKLSKKDLPELYKISRHLSFLSNVIGNESLKIEIPALTNNELQNIACELSDMSIRFVQTRFNALIKNIERPRKTKLAVIINGAGEVGKDAFITIIKNLKHDNLEVINISSVDKVKQAAHLLGWDGIKNEKGRSFLHKLKSMSVELYDGAWNYIQTSLYKANTNSIVFIHIREPEEIEKTKQLILAGYEEYDVKTLLITSDRGVKVINGADDVVRNYKYDDIISNDNGLDELTIKAESYIKKILPWD